ncbi:class I SAM-dependent DNA methyltransferase [Gracilibacillus alcaliphilus]|uniref:class I SAM-dependent DNA methyltransferase n=1 Tax=Gracilibacillus alcaliphilus TaxID=1401441 RepID=UPI00195E9F80|nr:class I SAM-dependent methyltransferase [Gracilibacillus alcaliphilus]MBM7679410.1 SAM-dependent methyltransferase [Gracilibacillus alcaliphilus]
MSYAKLAYIYDILMEDAPYLQWQEFVHHFGPASGRLLDLGCGTGKLSACFAQMGYQVTGVDYSEDMLAYAAANTTNIQYLQQDIRQLEGLHDYDIAVSLCDVINYLTSKQDVIQAFTKVYQSVKETGVFIFDVHSIKHFQEDMAGQTFAEIYEDITYVWLCEPGEASNSLLHDLTFFLQDEQTGQYERFDEQHLQRTFSIHDYLEMLRQAGWTNVQIYGDFQTMIAENPEENERIFFVCYKN